MYGYVVRSGYLAFHRASPVNTSNLSEKISHWPDCLCRLTVLLSGERQRQVPAGAVLPLNHDFLIKIARKRGQSYMFVFTENRTSSEMSTARTGHATLESLSSHAISSEHLWNSQPSQDCV